MKRYQCHKVVEAALVLDVAHSNDGSGTLSLSEEADRLVSSEFMLKHDPKPNGYFVCYEDGYESWSPAEAFEDGYTRVLFDEPESVAKTFDVVDPVDLRKKVADVDVFGDPDMWKLLCKVSSKAEGWMKTTKSMTRFDAGGDSHLGYVIQCETQQRNPDGSYSLSMAMVFVPA